MSLYAFSFTLKQNIHSAGGRFMNRTERFVTSIYQYLKILNPEELTIENVSEKLNLSIIYWPYTSEMTDYKGNFKVFINETLNNRQQWQDFGHEMSHYFKDQCNPNLLKESFVNYCESKADYFSCHFCVPTFMLMQLKGVTVYDVMNLFNVELDFAYKRLEMYKNKIIERMATRDARAYF